MGTTGRDLRRKNALRVLISWVAINNDPFERQWPEGGYRLVDGKPVPGPTLTVLDDADSPYAGTIGDVVLLYRETRDAAHDRERLPELRLHHVPWRGSDPTDHRAIFEFLREEMPELRQRFPDRELIIHVSPGTPSMQTIWVLMAETGFVEPPFILVKSYRRTDRPGRPAVVPVELGIETFYKVYRAARPRQIASEEQGVVWERLDRDPDAENGRRAIAMHEYMETPDICSGGGDQAPAHIELLYSPSSPTSGLLIRDGRAKRRRDCRGKQTSNAPPPHLFQRPPEGIRSSDSKAAHLRGTSDRVSRFQGARPPRARLQIGWGPRLDRQMRRYVPVVVAAGGTAGEATDHMLAMRLLRKLENRHDNRPERVEALKQRVRESWLELDEQWGPTKSIALLDSELRRLGREPENGG